MFSFERFLLLLRINEFHFALNKQKKTSFTEMKEFEMLWLIMQRTEVAVNESTLLHLNIFQGQNEV